MVGVYGRSCAAANPVITTPPLKKPYPHLSGDLDADADVLRKAETLARDFGRNFYITSRLRTHAEQLRQGAYSPSWSAKGMIAFVNYDDSSKIPGDIADGLYTIRPDGSRLRRIYSGGYLGPGQAPDWSPDGTRIAFAAATRDAPDNQEVFSIDANGRGLRRLTRFKAHLGGSVGAPRWSPDGKHITFVDNKDLYVVRPNGRGLRRIIDTPDQTPAETAWKTLGGPSWLPRLR